MKYTAELIPHRSRLFIFFHPLTSYIFTNGTVAMTWPLFKILNKTIVIGAENIGEEKNTVLLSNHQSMIDGFLIGFAAFFPKALWKPWLMPWHPAAYENFFSNPLMAFLSDNWKCIPVKPGRKDFGAMNRMERALRRGIMTVFPEGTRSRDGRLLPPRSGIGYVMMKTHPRAIPICMEGMDELLPVGCFIPRFFRTIFIYYGKPVDLSEFYGLEPSRETAQACIEKVFVIIHRQQKILKRYRRYRAYLLSKKPFFFRLYQP
ncbi:MAG: 1-acyl-sn-glycerol-3-phosphate acyltransferase [Elusimicrobia bacterium]|nr:1-acyl-sn-glycerol-3-phosphate acyltransferase [Elusimicrobiota bacterium]